MVHLPDVTQFMNQNVPEKIGLNEQELDIQADGSSRRTASPPRFLFTKSHFCKRDASFATELTQ